MSAPSGRTASDLQMDTLFHSWIDDPMKLQVAFQRPGGIYLNGCHSKYGTYMDMVKKIEKHAPKSPDNSLNTPEFLSKSKKLHRLLRIFGAKTTSELKALKKERADIALGIIPSLWTAKPIKLWTERTEKKSPA